MSRVVAIVEGDGEVEAIPVLLRNISNRVTPNEYPEILPPIRVRRDRFLNIEEDFSRHLLLAHAKCKSDGWILIVLDADDDCPKDLSARLLERAKTLLPLARISVVLANREYEAWFIASAQSLHGKRGFECLEQSADAETPRDAKGWMREHMQSGAYRPRTDQPAFSAALDVELAASNSRSFRKLVKEWQVQLARSEQDRGT